MKHNRKTKLRTDTKRNMPQKRLQPSPHPTRAQPHTDTQLFKLWPATANFPTFAASRQTTEGGGGNECPGKVRGLPAREEVAADTSPAPCRFGVSNREAPRARKQRVSPFPANSCRSSISEVFVGERRSKSEKRKKRGTGRAPRRTAREEPMRDASFELLLSEGSSLARKCAAEI